MGRVRRYLLELVPARLWMLNAWEKRARRNPEHYVADFRHKWENPEEYFATGNNDVERVLAVTNWGDTRNSRLLEIGCGNGRMTRGLCSRFGCVTGIDISPSMIREAKRLNSALPSAEFHVCSGIDLREFADASFDFVISYIVFQHIPRKAVIYRYIRESLRVLKPGGHFRFQARNDPLYGMPDTYTGAPVDLGEVGAIARECGRAILSVTGEQSFYCFVEIG